MTSASGSSKWSGNTRCDGRAVTTRDEEFLKQLRATFRVEAAEHLQTIAAGLVELEKTPPGSAHRKIVETVFRAAHSLKGAARAADFTGIESLCQSLEEVFASWKRGQSAPAADALDAPHRMLDAITSSLAMPAARPATDTPATSSAPRRSSRPAAPPTPPIGEATAAEETVRVAVAKLEARLLEAEELLDAKLTAAQRAADLRDLAARFDTWRRAWMAVEPNARRLRSSRDRGPAAAGHRSSEELSRLLDFFDWSADYLKSVEDNAEKLHRTARRDRHVLGKRVDDLLEGSKDLLLLPFATLAAPLPKLVRDLCRDQGKEADLTIRGQEIEIDKRILEEMKDPLVHLLRNCVDHGIESPGERARRDKPARGSITVAVTQVDGTKVQVLVSDDGAGIDTGKVKEAAVKRGLVPAEEADRLGEPEAQALIFQSEVSTSPIITQLSGRGLGLAIVRERAEKLGGEVSVESTAGRGTIFRIVVPATRATFRGILVEAAGGLWIAPTAQVRRVVRARPGDIQTVEGRETIEFGGRAVALVWLADALELPPIERTPTPGGTVVLILGAADNRVAFAVDAVLDELEVLFKPLRKPLSRVRNIAAATVLGSGRVVPILNVPDLLKSARKAASRPPLAAAAATAPAKTARKTILVAEDSITSRILLKAILESAGYGVKTAADGMEAFTLLRAEPVDLVVSDVEMPRLNGFDLTARIRADKKVAEVPVVLVTALETREDRERGIDAGANAYLVKSSFDQGNLLETIRRLI